MLASIPSARGHRAEPGAASGMDAMIRAARADGVTIRLTDSYRTYAQQVELKKRKPREAAEPGHSRHGWGLAFDIAVGGYGSAAYKWLAANGARFGFANPAWARQGGSKPEPWHWEFVGR